MSNNSGFAIAIAWPQTYCKQSGAWYDPLLNFLKISNNNFYRVGHAAAVLISKEEKKCHYFDFGRYHAPHGYGRARSGVTDHELDLKTIPLIDGKKITNFDEILTELQSKEVYHGEGDIHASYAEIDFEKAYKKAIQLQNDSPIIYGPFIVKGTNCSRFVNSVIVAGKPSFTFRFKLKYFVPLTPTPVSNVKALKFYSIKSKPVKFTPFVPAKQTKDDLNTTAQAPIRHESIPKMAQWLSGEGYGSWYFLEKSDKFLKMTRFSPYGKIECTGFFDFPSNFKLDEDYQITYLSHCTKISVIVNENLLELNKVEV